MRYLERYEECNVTNREQKSLLLFSTFHQFPRFSYTPSPSFLVTAHHYSAATRSAAHSASTH